ncbi:MAG: asparagine synthase-related protein, partial [Gemmatimonadales bacterium]
FRVPADRQMQGVWNKALLRGSLRGRIPEAARTRAEKMGFPTSLHVWLTSTLAEPLGDILASRAARERGIYDVKKLLQVLRNKHHPEPRDALRLFSVAQFELWHTLQRDRPPTVALRDPLEQRAAAPGHSRTVSL